MPTDNHSVTAYISEDIHKSLINFKDKSGYNSISKAVTAVLEEYFCLDPNINRILEIEENVRNNSQQLSEHSEKLSQILERLNQTDKKPATDTVSITSSINKKQVKSLKPTHPSTKQHSTAYGNREAASMYPGWESSANISYVFDRYQLLNTDEARAAFADKWIGLCVQSIDRALVVCYKLLDLVQTKKMYKIPHWMEENRTHINFEDYFEYRFQKLLSTWLNLELNYQFVTKFSSLFEDYRKKLNRLLSYEQKENTNSINFINNSQLVELEQERDGNHTNKNLDDLSIKNNSPSIVSAHNARQQLNVFETINSTEIGEREDVKTMTKKEILNFSQLTENQLKWLKTKNKLPSKISVNGIDYTIDYQKRNCWTVTRLKQQKPIQLTSSEKPLTQVSLSQRLNVHRSTIRRKQNRMSELDFAEWTRSKDPDGIAWRYQRDSKNYIPLNPTLSD